MLVGNIHNSFRAPWCSQLMYSQDRDNGEYRGSLLCAWNLTRKDWRKLRMLQAMYSTWAWPSWWKSTNCVTPTTQPRTLHKPLHKTGHTIGFNVMPSNIRWGQWPSPHPAAVTSEKERPFQERVGTSYAGTGNPTERQREALQQLLCLKCKMWMCLEEVPASITVCKHSLWRRASPVSHSSLP